MAAEAESFNLLGVLQALLLFVLGILGWNVRRMVRDIDGKADKDHLDEQLEQMRETQSAMFDRLDRYHGENTARMDSMMFELQRRRGQIRRDD